jgi:hypothetical protein
MGHSNLSSNLASKVSVIAGVTLIVILLDLFLAFYAMSHGFAAPSNAIMVSGIDFQLQWLPLVGLFILSVAVFNDVFARIFPRWLSPEADPMSRLRFIRVAAVCLAVFVCFLYVPYLLGSNWFWRHLSHASHAVVQLNGFGTWLQSVEMPILALDPIWQYSITQILASAALVSFAWVLARPAKRPRKIR